MQPTGKDPSRKRSSRRKSGQPGRGCVEAECVSTAGMAEGVQKHHDPDSYFSPRLLDGMGRELALHLGSGGLGWGLFSY